MEGMDWAIYPRYEGMDGIDWATYPRYEGIEGMDWAMSWHKKSTDDIVVASITHSALVQHV